MTSAAAWAQSAAGAGSLSSLEQAAKQRTAAWQRLADNLESSVARMLPCDPKIAAAISEAGRASEERLTSVAAYVAGASKEANQDTEMARRALASAEGLAADLGAEKSDAAMEQGALEAQLANLSASVKQRASLDESQKALQQIAALAKQRADLAQSASNRHEALIATLRALVAEFVSREDALKGAGLAFEAERSRWNSYYAARLTRAQTECAIVKGGPVAPAASGSSNTKGAPAPAQPRPQGKKQ